MTKINADDAMSVFPRGQHQYIGCLALKYKPLKNTTLAYVVRAIAAKGERMDTKQA